jgi:hypothetical protein
MINKPLTLEEIEHFDQMLKYDLDTVVRCSKCGRTQYLQLKFGIQDGWDECCGSVMPIIYHKISKKTEEEIIRILKLEYIQKASYSPKGSQVF